MNVKYIAALVLTVALAVGGWLAFSSWLAAHDARIIMESVIKEKDAQIAQRDKENAELKDKLAKQPIQQVVKYVPQIVKVPAGVSEPLPIPVPNQLTPAQVAQLPDAPSVLTPEPTFRLLMQQAADDIVCRKDLADREAQLAVAKSAAKGGGFWHRFKSGSKWFVVGGAIGGVTVAILKH